MANKTIPQLTDLSSLAAGGLLVVDTGVQSFKMTLANLIKSIVPLMSALPPIGAIVPYVPGYFTNASNAGYAVAGGPAANTEVAVAAYLLAQGGAWRVCNGNVPNDADSPIYNTNARYMPNLSDQRFLRGNTTCGAIGGADSVTLAITNLPSHNHGATGLSNASSSVSGSTGSTSTGTKSANASHNHTDPGGNPAKIYTGAGGTPAFGSSGVGSFVSLASTNTDHTHSIPSLSVSGTAAAQTISGNTANTGSGTAFSIIPKFLDCFYIQRIK